MYDPFSDNQFRSVQSQGYHLASLVVFRLYFVWCLLRYKHSFPRCDIKCLLERIKESKTLIHASDVGTCCYEFAWSAFSSQSGLTNVNQIVPAFATLNTETQQQQRTTSRWSFKPFLINSRSLCRARRKLHVVCLFVCLFLFPMHIPWFVFNHHAHLGKLCSSLKQPLYEARFATEIIIEPVLQLFSPCFMLSLSPLLVSAPFHVTSLQFHPDGNILMLLGKDQMCLCFLTDPRT